MRKNYHEEEEYFEDDEQLDLVDLIFALLRRWKVIVLISAPIILLGLFFAMTKPTLYRAETKMIIINSNQSTTIAASDLYINQKLVTTYTQLAKSRDIMERVINKFDLNETPGSLASKVSIIPIPETELMKLSYTSGDSKLAPIIANELTNEFIYKVSQVMRVRNISIIENATVAYEIPKNRAIIVIASIILGLAMGCGVAGVIELLHKKLRKSSDIERILGAKMLGMIPEVKLEEEREANHEA